MPISYFAFVVLPPYQSPAPSPLWGEHWVFVKGTALFANNGKEFFVRTGESTFVPTGTKNWLENPRPYFAGSD